MKNKECAYCGAYNEDCEEYCVVCRKTLLDYDEDDEEISEHNEDQYDR